MCELKMRSLPTLLLLVVAAHAIPLGGAPSRLQNNDQDVLPPLRGLELLKATNSKHYDDIEAVAKLLAKHKGELTQRLKEEQDEVYRNNKEAIDRARIEAAQLSWTTPEADRRRSIWEINAELGLDEVLVEGDMILSLEQAKAHFGIDDDSTTGSTRTKRQAFRDEYYPGTIFSDGFYYIVGAELGPHTRRAIELAVNFWQAHTCIKFHKVNGPEDTDVRPIVRFYRGSGCTSALGRQVNTGATTKDHTVWKEEQEISLGAGCESASTAAHEIGHALGVFHEQERTDRDNSVWIDTSNIEDGSAHNFRKVMSTVTYGKPYDYGSIMHYGPYDFANDSSKPVIVSLNPEYQTSFGISKHFSDLTPTFADVFMMNTHYNCYDKCPNAETACKNDGRPNPNDCSVCECPKGFGGKDCSEREAPSLGMDCGEDLEAKRAWKAIKIEGVVGSGITGDFANPSKCTWHVKAPEGQKIEYKVMSVGTGDDGNALCDERCTKGAVTLKGLEKSWMAGEMRICCQRMTNKSMTTASNLLVVQPYNVKGYTDFEVQYRLVSEPVKEHQFGEYILVSTEMTFEDAEEHCESKGNYKLASIHKRSVQDKLIQEFRKVDPYKSTFWIGLKKAAGLDSPFTWVDGSPLDFTNWPNGVSNSDKEQCVAYWRNYWRRLPCSQDYNFVCQEIAEEPTTTTLAPTEEPVEEHQFGDYILVTTPMTFEEAESHCEFKGDYQLVVIHESGVDQMLKDKLDSITPKKSPFWIGLKKEAGLDSPFAWVDGSPLDYTNWPKVVPKPSEKELCVAYYNKFTKWGRVDCTVRNNFACQKIK